MPFLYGAIGQTIPIHGLLGLRYQATAVVPSLPFPALQFEAVLWHQDNVLKHWPVSMQLLRVTCH